MNRTEAAELVNSLFETLNPSLFLYACRSSGSPELAEDLIQEVFMALYRDLRRGCRIEKPRAWIFGAIKNQLNKHRSQQQRREELISQELARSARIQHFPEKGQDAQEDDVARLLSVLTPREEEAILLRMQSLTYREIAEQLEISAKSVATLLARALRKLQKAARAQSLGLRVSARQKDDVRDPLQ